MLRALYLWPIDNAHTLYSNMVAVKLTMPSDMLTARGLYTHAHPFPHSRQPNQWPQRMTMDTDTFPKFIYVSNCMYYTVSS